jgi:hypothetical protein
MYEKNYSYNLLGPYEKETAGAEVSPSGNFQLFDCHEGEVIVAANLSDTKTAIIQVLCSAASTGASSSNVGDTVTLTGSSAVPLQCATIRLRQEDLTNVSATKVYVGVSITTNQNADLICAIFRKNKPRVQTT